MSDATRKAHCLCGAVRITLMGEPERTVLCSCTDCQMISGSPYGWSTYWPTEATEINGATNSYARPAQLGRTLELHFCPTCGSTVWWKPGFAPEWVGVAGGAIRKGPALPDPGRAYWTKYRPGWSENLAPIPTLEEQGGR